MPCQEDFDEPDEPPEPEDVLDVDDEADADMVFENASDDEEFVEFDPSGRYGRYAEVLGKGAMKTVYRAYDLIDCTEVAWNKVRPLAECSDEQAVAVQREILILQKLNHKGIIKLFSAWGGNGAGDTDFITELCSSTLLEYRTKHKHISRKAVRSWGRQILLGLAHLHSQDPPIIHRDLKCENILVKCRSNTALKIGDFGSATFLDETHHMHTLVGTPEFMAPEMYREDYNELVDVYAFGMCVLELLTRECPYSECKSLGQIYKKVIRGEMPRALSKVKDLQALRLINRCLLPACKRPSANELLCDPFLRCGGDAGNANSGQTLKSWNSLPSLRSPNSSLGVKTMLSSHDVISRLSRQATITERKAWDMVRADTDTDPSCKPSAVHGQKVALFAKSPSFRRSYQVMGRVDTLRLTIRIQESSRSCNIEFPFDLRSDSPRSVAEEMVRALEYSESDLNTITDLITKEMEALTPLVKERLDMRAIPLGGRGSFRERRLSASHLDTKMSFRQSSCFASGTINGVGNDIAQHMDTGGRMSNPASFSRRADNSCKTMEGGAEERMSNLASSSHRADNSCKAMEGRADERQCGCTKGDPVLSRDESCRDSFSCEVSTSEQAAMEIICKLSCDAPSVSSGACNASRARGFPSRTITGASGECTSSSGIKRNPLLDSETVCIPPSPRWERRRSSSSSRFQQVPAGIGILLRPSSELGLRRVGFVVELGRGTTDQECGWQLLPGSGSVGGPSAPFSQYGK